MVKKSKMSALGLGVGSSLLATALATGALAQVAPGSSPTALPTETLPRDGNDMRLLSFGDCDRRFPYGDSKERKECARVVGSEEAKEARAYYLCAASHQRDPAEAARCRAAYQENRKRAAEEGFSATGASRPKGEASPEMIEKVRAITAIGVEHDRAAAAQAAADPAAALAPATSETVVDATLPDQDRPGVARDSWSLATIVGVLSFFLLVIAGGAAFVRRRQTAVSGQY